MVNKRNERYKESIMLIDDFKRARRISTPIIAITTADQEATINLIAQSMKPNTPLISYDVARGPLGLNIEGDQAVSLILEGEMELVQLLAEDPSRAMIKALDLPEDSVLFFLNAQRQVSDPRTAQTIALMRDSFKSNRRTIVLLGPQFSLPEQISGDVMMLDDPLPGPEEIGHILDKTYGYVKVGLPEGKVLPDLNEDTRRRAIEAVRGLHTAAIDQAFSFSMELTGINIPMCWLQKRDRVEQTRGLTFYRGGETYNDVGGLTAFKRFMEELYNGPEPFRLIVWLDEIEKMIEGSVGYSGDGGVGADQLSCVLTNMEDNGWTGAIAVGHSGTGKSILAKATGNNWQLPCIRMDLGAMKGSLVGESEGLIRQSMKVLQGIADSGAFFIATCNGIGSMPPELIRRFSLGRTWFFDLPDDEEKESIWRINQKKFGVEQQQRPDDDDWTGSDIRDCCRAAYRRRKSLVDISRQIIPLARQNPERVRQLRELASGSFLSASYEGAYIYSEEDDFPQIG
ncbi:MAG TPA: AAA family ATPase, partial [Methylomirabilota bacterium]|nr:AAA family ATPase [Methylomirabilota bacterium]